jgi:hypothetical protein
MTRKLEELFDLPTKSDDAAEPVVESGSDLQLLPQSLQTLDKIELALPAVKGLDASDQEMDELASSAKESFDNLMDLGMQVDSRYASEIFAVAGTMLGHAITAKTAKINKKLKMIDLQLRKQRLDLDSGTDTTPTAQGVILDRNELLDRILKPRTDSES